ncbi:hypothetical protein LIA77_09304 [Sarocladium implicatum]|nr:hypothetical protein LIA77_09304 [Sarocladium implicatum]
MSFWSRQAINGGAAACRRSRVRPICDTPVRFDPVIVLNIHHICFIELSTNHLYSEVPVSTSWPPHGAWTPSILDLTSRPAIPVETAEYPLCCHPHLHEASTRQASSPKESPRVPCMTPTGARL